MDYNLEIIPILNMTELNLDGEVEVGGGTNMHPNYRKYKTLKKKSKKSSILGTSASKRKARKEEERKGSC